MNADAVADDKMLEAEPAYTPTILDYLNEDCWRAVFNYLPGRDIIQSERVSRRWQTVVLVYLRGARIGIEHPYPTLGSNELHRNACWVLARDLPSQSFESWTNKLGASLVSTYCASEECLRIIGENCPNLEAVKFMDLPDQLLRSSQNEHFRWLQRICFIRCPCVSDRCIVQYATSQALEELEIHRNQQITGQCLRNIKSNLKSLVLNQCRSLDHRNLCYLERFSDLTKLVLNFRSVNILFPLQYGHFRDVHLALRHLRKLEHLEIYFNDNGLVDRNLIRAVCELERLRHLGGQIVYTDDDLMAVIRSCNQLRSLHLVTCYHVTSEGLSAACRAAPQLTALGFHQCRFTDDDVLACIRDCPDLTLLDVRRCACVTRAVMPRAAAARQMQRARRPLHLYVDGVVVDLRVNGDMNKYEELILHF